MTTHYIITNRLVTRVPTSGSIKVNATEYLRTDGADEAQDNLRYGEVRFTDRTIIDKVKNNKPIALDDVKIVLHPDLHREDYTDPEQYEKAAEKFNFGSQKVFDKLHQKGLEEAHEGDILVFVHGFNNDLRESIETLCQLHVKYIREGSPIKHIVLFTWPARKNLLRYRDDARDAIKSGYALARALDKLRAQFRALIHAHGKFCDHRMHLMAHSMGNRVVEAMMTELLASGTRPNNLFGEIFLMAADVDDDCMAPQRPMHQLISLGERVHAYYHRRDMALGVSEKTKNAFNRLGRWGSRRTIELPDDVYQAEVTYVADEDTLGLRNLFSSPVGYINHWYYLKSEAVVTDVIEVLNGKVSTFNY